jgi:hypothetical protein
VLLSPTAADISPLPDFAQFTPHTPPQQTAIMAEASGNVPTFKLVLVGDGGTGKVR